MRDAGKAIPFPKGEYNSTETYEMLDFVEYDGSTYIAKKDSAGNVPPEDNEYWQLMAQKGSSGGAVTGVKGNAESTYRQGNVNLTKDNIGLGNVANERQYSASNPQPSVDTATKAAQDGNGNNIVNTYATKVEMNAVKKSVSDGKTLVASAITAKGVATAADAEFATMAANVSKIKTTPNLQQKSVTLNTGAPSAAITPDAGYDGLSQVTASVSLQEKTQTLLHGSADVTPDSGKVLSKVTVNGPANKGGVTVDASAVTQDSNYTYFGIPAAGYYNTSSKLRSANSNLIPKNTVQVQNDGVFPKEFTITVPNDAKSGLLMLYGAGWNSVKVMFTEPTGDGIVAATKIYDAYTGRTGLIHMIIYQVSLRPSKPIVASAGWNSTTGAEVQGSANMQLLY